MLPAIIKSMNFKGYEIRYTSKCELPALYLYLLPASCLPSRKATSVSCLPSVYVFCFYYLCCSISLSDINEHSVVVPCHVQATCMNTTDSFVCACNSGYSGNGSTCTGKAECL